MNFLVYRFFVIFMVFLAFRRSFLEVSFFIFYKENNDLYIIYCLYKCIVFILKYMFFFNDFKSKDCYLF